jgi:hypothetical protein
MFFFTWNSQKCFFQNSQEDCQNIFFSHSCVEEKMVFAILKLELFSIYPCNLPRAKALLSLHLYFNLYCINSNVCDLTPHLAFLLTPMFPFPLSLKTYRFPFTFDYFIFPEPLFFTRSQKLFKKITSFSNFSHQGNPGREKFQNEAKVKNYKNLKRPRPSLFPRII